MTKTAAKPFKVKVHLSLRYIMRLTDEGYVADCIDAGACGIGDTQPAAMQDLIENLEALHEAAVESGLDMVVPARDDEEKEYARLMTKQLVDPAITGYGVVRRIELTPTAAGKRLNLPASLGFEVSQHVSLAA